MKYCTNCGREMQDDQRFCPYCGTPHPTAVPNNTKTPAQNIQPAAVQNAQYDVVKELLHKGVYPDVCDDHGRSALFIAAENGDLATVELLLRHGADINKADQYGRTPFQVALSNGHISVTQTLIQSGTRFGG